MSCFETSQKELRKALAGQNEKTECLEDHSRSRKNQSARGTAIAANGIKVVNTFAHRTYLCKKLAKK